MTSSTVALGSLLVALSSLVLTAFLAVLNRRAQVADREADAAEAHRVRLWNQKVPAILDYLTWLEVNAADPSRDERFPAPDDALYVRVATFGPDGIEQLIARARVTFARLREVRAGHATGDGSEHSVIEASHTADLALSTIRTLLRLDLTSDPATARARGRAFLRALDEPGSSGAAAP